MKIQVFPKQHEQLEVIAAALADARAAAVARADPADPMASRLAWGPSYQLQPLPDAELLPALTRLAAEREANIIATRDGLIAEARSFSIMSRGIRWRRFDVA